MLIGIFGTGRNGSTLLGRLLDGISETYIHPIEENFLSALSDLERFGAVRRTTGQHCTVAPLRSLSSPISFTRLRAMYQASLDTLHDLAKINLPDTSTGKRFVLDALLSKPMYLADEFVRDYLRAAGNAVCPSIQFRHYLFKTIETPYVTDYALHFPDMRFIHIIRDPVVVCSSQKRSLMQSKGRPATYLGHDWLVCMIQKRWIPHAKEILKHQADPRHIVVRYEDLVLNPTEEIGRIAQWLELKAPINPDVLTIFGGHDFVELDDNPSKAGVNTPREALSDLRVVFGYEEVLTTREIDLINYKTAELQKQFGYKPSSSPSLSRVLAQYACVDKWEWVNVHGISGILRALIGMVYRRVSIF